MRRQLYVAGRAVEQSEPDSTFQLSDQHAQPGWRNEERFGSARETSMLRHAAGAVNGEAITVALGGMW
jgi:hypothetical protein